MEPPEALPGVLDAGAVLPLVVIVVVPFGFTVTVPVISAPCTVQ